MPAVSTTHEDLKQSVGQSRIVGAATAGLRALASQLFTFYVRVPVKLFRPTRVDYLAIPRAINPEYHSTPWSLFTHSSPALLTHAVKKYGWSFIPNHVLPPLIANSAIGLVLYTSYLTSLAVIAGPKAKEYDIRDTFKAGFIAGAAQSLAAAPIDAIVTRFSASELLHSSHKTMWSYSLSKLIEIGPQGVFAGYPISFIKESVGFACFFATFETVKGQWYRTYIKYFHNGEKGNRALYPSFILGAGALAAVSVQAVHYPIGKIQKLHLMRLEALDEINKNRPPTSKYSMWKLYSKTYMHTFEKAAKLVQKDAGGSWFRWLYAGFSRTTLTTMPSTSIGLVVFEIMRIRYSVTDDEPPAFQSS